MRGTSATAPHRPRPTRRTPIHVAGPYQARLTVSDGVNSTLSTPMTHQRRQSADRDHPVPDRWSDVQGGRRHHLQRDRDRRRGRHAAGERLHLEHRLPARRPRASGHSHHRRDERHVHDPDQRARFQRLHPISHHAHGHRLERAAIDKLGDHLPAEGQSHLRYRARRADPVPGRHRPHGAVRLRHADRLQPHHRSAQPDHRRQHIQLRLMVRRRRADAHHRRARSGRKPTPRTTMSLPRRLRRLLCR